VKNSAIPVPVETSETLKDREVLAVTFSGSVTYVLHRAMSAEAKAAAEKAAAEEVTKAKAAAQKAAADAADALRAELQAKAKAKAEAEAAANARSAAEVKAANEAKAAAKAKADAEANAKAESEAALVRAVNDLKAATATIAKLNDSNAELNRVISSLSASNKNQQDQINALSARITALLNPKPTTIVCAKGTTTKTVKAINPVCPAGYKKK
jgi:molecular chaperone GrpE (heat shock protein)